MVGFQLGRCDDQEIQLAPQPCPGREEVLFEDPVQLMHCRKGVLEIGKQPKLVPNVCFPGQMVNL